MIAAVTCEIEVAAFLCAWVNDEKVVDRKDTLLA